jgi:hypothetical protein
MKPARLSALAILVLAAAACTGADAVIVGNSINAVSAAIDPPVMRAVDGIKGWKRADPPERYNREGLYGYIDGGAELVLSYGFRALSVFRFEAVGAKAPAKEAILEIYRMGSGDAAFGLYGTKLEGGEAAWPAIKSDNWTSAGQGSMVKGDYLVNVLAPECDAREIGEFLAAVDKKLPARRTVRPAGLNRLPAGDMLASSRRYILGPVAARNETPFLDGDFWGFGGPDRGESASLAYSAKYGPAPAVSKLVVVELGRSVDAQAVDAGVLALFEDYLQDVASDGDVLEGRNQAGRWFLFGRAGTVAALVLGDPDRAAAAARLAQALSGPGK